jgi:hypothetical protein
VPLFNPRRQVWREHFRWNESGIEIIGLTSCGRATAIALKLNNEYLTRARRRWVLAGWHPRLYTERTDIELIRVRTPAAGGGEPRVDGHPIQVRRAGAVSGFTSLCIEIL